MIERGGRVDLGTYSFHLPEDLGGSLGLAGITTLRFSDWALSGE